MTVGDATTTAVAPASRRSADRPPPDHPGGSVGGLDRGRRGVVGLDEAGGARALERRQDARVVAAEVAAADDAGLERRHARRSVRDERAAARPPDPSESWKTGYRVLCNENPNRRLRARGRRGRLLFCVRRARLFARGLGRVPAVGGVRRRPRRPRLLEVGRAAARPCSSSTAARAPRTTTSCPTSSRSRARTASSSSTSAARAGPSASRTRSSTPSRTWSRTWRRSARRSASGR